MIAVVAPFPRPGRVREGWMSRIAAIDRLFEREQRVYLDVVDDGDYRAVEPEQVSDTASVLRLNLSIAAHYDRLRNAILGAEMVYVHTFHLARWVLPFYRTGKIVTDVHGATAEEEVLYQKPAAGRFYDEVERVVLAESRYAVVVTEAMADHLRRKHPRTRCDFIVLPIMEAIHGTRPLARPDRAPSARPCVVYSGGAQRWQNVDLMLDVARERIDTCDFRFLTNEVDVFARAAQARGLDGRVGIEFVAKEDLARAYGDADFGLVLRDEMVVNRVACPTKLSEYLWFGLIPIVRFAELGDFARLGYRYVTLEDFRRGRLPGADEQRAMREQNAQVIARLNATFEQSAATVQTLARRLPAATFDPIAFLSDRERNVLYPTWSFLQVERPAGPRMLTEHFALPYDRVAFDVGDERDVRRLTWMPIDRECQIVLREIEVTDAAGAELAHRLSGNWVHRNGDTLTFGTRPPLVHLDFDATTRPPRRFAARFDVVLLGDEVLRVPGAAPAAAGVPAEAPPPPRGRVYTLLTSSPLVLEWYRRFVKPTRDRLRARRQRAARAASAAAPPARGAGPYPCLEHFAQTIGLPATALAKAYEIEQDFHRRILGEPDVATRRRMYREVYETVHAIYGSVPSDEVFTSEPNPKEHMLWLFEPELAGKSVLDVGCGRGALLVGIARRLPHGRLLGLDAVVPRSDGDLGIEFQAADIVEFETDGTFDVVSSDNVIEHVAPADLDAHLQSVRRALRPGGTFIVLTPNRHFGPWDVTRIVDDSYAGAVPAAGTHLNEMTYRELLTVLERNGFDTFRTVLPIAKIRRRFGRLRMPARLMSAAEAMPRVIERLRAIPEKWRHLPAFEITVLCRRR